MGMIAVKLILSELEANIIFNFWVHKKQVDEASNEPSGTW